jgi:sulfhydrogenase subunit beta (sulfur reductase)
MLFRILPKDEFTKLLEIMLASNEIIGPKKIGADKDGAPIHQYLPIGKVYEIDLDYETTEFSAKTYFLPYMETLSSYKFEQDDWKQEISYRIQPRVIVGRGTSFRARTTSQGARTRS